MRKIIPFFLLTLLTIGTVQAQVLKKNIVADWQGTLEVKEGTSMQVRFHVRYIKGEYKATMDSVSENVMGMKCDEVKYVDGILTLKIKQINGSFTGKLDGDELKGTWKQGNVELPLNLKRMRTS